MSIFLGAVKSNKKELTTYFFEIYDYTNFMDNQRPRLVKVESVKRTNYNSAYDYIYKKWSNRENGFVWRMQPVGEYKTEAQKKDFYKRNPELKK